MFIKMRRIKRKLVMMKAPESLYNKIDLVRKKFREKNGFDITLIQASDLLAKSVKNPIIPTLFKNAKKKGGPY